MDFFFLRHTDLHLDAVAIFSMSNVDRSSSWEVRLEAIKMIYYICKGEVIPYEKICLYDRH